MPRQSAIAQYADAYAAPIGFTAPQPAAATIALVVCNDRPQPAAAALPDFSALERKVIMLSRNDVAPAGPIGLAIARLTRPLFGLEAPRALADPRLEALRRFAIFTRIECGRPSRGEIARFVAAGFDAAQIDAVYALCWERNPRRRGFAARRRHVVMAIAIWSGILPPVAAGLTDYFDDDLLGPLGASLLFAGIAPMLAKLRRRR
jgi:hypothetical protein